MVVVTSKHVVLLYCNGACSVNKGYKKHTHTHTQTHTHTNTHTHTPHHTHTRGTHNGMGNYRKFGSVCMRQS